MKNKKIIATGIMAAALLPVLYLLFIRSQVIPAVEGKAVSWFQFMIDSLYPRLATESHRFPAEFFLQKADQVILRFSLIMLGISLFSWVYNSKDELRSNVHIYFEKQISVKNASYLIFFIYLYLLYTSWDIYMEYLLLIGISDFYTPIFPFKYLYPNFPSPLFTGIVFGLFVLSCLLSAFKIKPLLSSIAAILTFTFLYSIRMGFEKIDHGFTTILYALLLLPFLMYAFEKAKKNKSDLVEAWSIQLIKVIIPMCYFMAALEKLLTSGIWWLKADNFKTLLYINQQPLGLLIMKSTILCTLFPLVAWLFQISFISVLKWPKLIPYFLITGILFHQGTYFLFGAGDPFTPWIAVYVFFLPGLHDES